MFLIPVMIPVRVVVGTRTICQRAKLFEDSATVKMIIDGALARTRTALPRPGAARRRDGSVHAARCSWPYTQL